MLFLWVKFSDEDLAMYSGQFALAAIFASGVIAGALYIRAFRKKVVIDNQRKTITFEEAYAQIKRNHKPDHRQNKGYQGITRSNARGTPDEP
jgi:hypothetical protein